jgi:acyl carrier protein
MKTVHSMISIKEIKMLNGEHADADTVAAIGKLIATQFPWVALPAPDLAAQRFREDLDLDSLHMVEFQSVAEDEFGIIFDPDDEDLFDALSTIGALASYVQRHRARAY